VVKWLAVFFTLVVLSTGSHAEQLAPYFKDHEFADRYTGDKKINLDFVRRLSLLRQICGFPFIINSGYRTSKHPVEINKATIGKHTLGIAVDIRVTSARQRQKIVSEAIKLGFRGIGIHKNFVHVDMRNGPLVIWIY